MEQTVSGMIVSFFKSKKLSVVLFIFVLLASTLSLFIPQQAEPGIYDEKFGSFFSWLIKSTGFNDIFHSLIFLIPLCVFIANLLISLIERLYREFSGKSKKRFGPDFIYAGILILIAGQWLSIQFGQRENIRLEAGKAVNFGMHYLFTLLDSTQVFNNDGKDMNRILNIEVKKDNKVIVPSYPVRKNHPLHVDDLSVSPSSFEEKPYIILTSEKGEVKEFPQGIPIRTSPYYIIFDKVITQEDPGAVSIEFLEIDKNNTRNSVTLKMNDKIAGYTITDIRKEAVAVLSVTRNPGFILSWIGCVVCVIGGLAALIRIILDKRKKT